MSDFINDKIKDYISEEIQKQERMRRARESLIRLLEREVRDSLQISHLRIEPFGSFSTGLLTRFSDLDLSICGLYSLSRFQVVQVISELFELFSSKHYVARIKEISSAQIPVLKLVLDFGELDEELRRTHPGSRFQAVDLSIEQFPEDFEDPSSTRTTSFLSSISSRTPNFQPAVLLLKLLFQVRQWNNAYSGGVNSYGLCLLYLAFLGEKNKFEEEFGTELMRQFFSFLGELDTGS